MSLTEEIKETIIYIIMGLALASIINLGLGFALGAEKPVMAVVSNSMYDTLYKGDLVVVKGIKPEEVKVRDIIVYHNPCRDIDVVHRVVNIKVESTGNFRCSTGRIVPGNNKPDLTFYTKGDNERTNPYTDQKSRIAPPLRGEWIKGQVILVIPKLGWFKVILTESLSSYGIFNVALAVIVIVGLIMFIGEMRRKRRKGKT